jgi:hypothetical protein
MPLNGVLQRKHLVMLAVLESCHNETVSAECIFISLSRAVEQSGQRLVFIMPRLLPLRHAPVSSHRSDGPKATNTTRSRICHWNEDTILISCSVRLLVFFTRARITVSKTCTLSLQCETIVSLSGMDTAGTLFLLQLERPFYPSNLSLTQTICYVGIIYNDISWLSESNQYSGQSCFGPAHDFTYINITNYCDDMVG